MPVGRYAPSPTGDLHVGNLRTALVAWLFARSAGSRFLMRIEDLDTVAAKAAYAESQLADLSALGLDWDEPVVHQSGRLDIYAEAVETLRDAGLTYPCYCSRREIREAGAAPNAPLSPDGFYPGTCRGLTATDRRERERDGRTPALRIRAEGRSFSFDDLIAGPYTGTVDDFVIERKSGEPSYNLAVVIDDDAAGVEQVVRGDDLVSSTPRHLLLYELFERTPPSYAHVPLVLNAAGDRLAKRDGAVTLADRAELGEDATQVRSWLARSLGLAGPTETPDVTTLLERFDAAELPREPWRLLPADTAAASTG